MSGPTALAASVVVAAAALATGLAVGGLAGIAAGLATVAAAPAALTTWEAATGGPEALPAAVTYTGATALLAAGAWLLA